MARAPWLARLRALVRAHLDAGPDGSRPGLVLACSALRAAYRETLHASDAGVLTVWLDASQDVLAARLAARVAQGRNPVGPSLLPSQLATFEPPVEAGQAALRLDATRPVGALVADVAAAVRGTIGEGAAFQASHSPVP